MSMEYDAAMIMSEYEESTTSIDTHTIGYIEEADLENLSSIWSRFTLIRYPNNTPDRGAWIHQTIRLISSGIYIGIKITIDGKIIGFADGVAMYEPATSNMTFMGRHSWLEPELRGKGLGKALYLGMIEEARSRGCVDLQIISPYVPGRSVEEQLERDSMPNKMHKEIGNGPLKPFLVVMRGEL